MNRLADIFLEKGGATVAFLSLSIYFCLRLCVYERERGEREREGKGRGELRAGNGKMVSKKGDG